MRGLHPLKVQRMHEVAKSVIHSELISVLSLDFRGTHSPFCLVNKNQGDEKILASCQTSDSAFPDSSYFI